MDVPPSSDRVFDFPMAEPEPHPAYDFFAAQPIPGLSEAPGQPFLYMTHGTYMPPSVIEDLCVRMDNLEYGHGALVKKMGTVSDAQVADGIAIREIWPRVTTVEGQVQVMVS
ncbi:hypothetical protein Tco_0165593 [Tanacetum coccineum]